MQDALRTYEGELSVLGMMWDPRAARRLIETVRPDYFAWSSHRVLWGALSALVARGDEVEFNLILDELQAQGHTVEDAGGIDFIASTMDYAPVGVRDPSPQARILRDRWTARTLHGFCEKTMSYLEGGKAGDGGRKMADYLASKSLGLFSDQGTAAHRSRSELIDDLLSEATTSTDGPRGIHLPFQGLNEEVGPISEGEVMGISAYSGGGKTTLAANLVNGILKSGVPVVIFGTEMGKRWVARMAAIESQTSQWCAEKKSWVRKVRGEWVPWEEGLDRYRAALRRMRDWPMEVVTAADITAQEVITRTRVLRRKYSGQHVVAVVDHLHRLDYGRIDPSKMVGQVTRDFKNHAVEDPDGLSYILLYQPRKPEEVAVMDRPVSYHQIRGDALVGNELDIHISPFRYWVKTDDWFKTPWGSPLALTDTEGMPQLASRPDDPLNQKGIKLSDEHVFIANDKRRIEGPGPNHMLYLHKPSGRMSERKGEVQTELWRDDG